MILRHVEVYFVLWNVLRVLILANFLIIYLKDLHVKGLINSLNNYVHSILCSKNHSKGRHHYYFG